MIGRVVGIAYTGLWVVIGSLLVIGAVAAFIGWLIS